MYSSEDLKLFFQVLDGVLASWGVCPVVLFKKMIPYNFFQKRYKEIRKKIVAVKVDGLPWNASLAPQSPESECLVDASVQIWVEIWMSIGLQLSQKNLNY